jgi:pimeloyl-ACP methyl ester carboxylesterase
MHLPSRYVVGRELGRGGMGIVYEADDNRLGRKVAIKVLHTGPEQPGKHRFAREARAASALNHPNIITIHDIDAADDGDFIVMELVDGVSLSRLSQDGPVAIGRAIDFGIQIAGALAASHSADIVHRRYRRREGGLLRSQRRRQHGAAHRRGRAVVLLSGGLPAIPRPPEADPINFAPHITAPTLMLNGRDDFIFPLDSVARPLFSLLGAPAKQMEIHDGGHIPPLNELIRDVLGWFDQYLGPVAPR